MKISWNSRHSERSKGLEISFETQDRTLCINSYSNVFAEKGQCVFLSCTYGSTIPQLKVVIDLLYKVLMHSHLKSSQPALQKTLPAASQQTERSSKKSNKNYQDGFRTDLGGKIRSAKCG